MISTDVSGLQPHRRQAGKWEVSDAAERLILAAESNEAKQEDE